MTVMKMMLLVLADSRVVQALAEGEGEAQRDGLAEAQVDVGKAYDRLDGPQKDGTEFEALDPPRAAVFVAKAKWWGFQGALDADRWSKGFASMWTEEVIMATAQQMKQCMQAVYKKGAAPPGL